MTALDWLVLVGTLGLIVGYGAYSSRGVRTVDEYVRGDNTLKWPTIGLGIMATQASAITFLSTPGQAYQDGMRFVQFYFGLPLAMIVICVFFVPMYYKLDVLTAYQYLEHRFDGRVRTLGAVLFLVQRGLAAGITIYAPSIILSSVLGWSLELTNVIMGLTVVVYTVLGGQKAVSQTQKQQMVVMLGGMVVATLFIVWKLPPDVSVSSAVKLAGALDRMNVVSFELDLDSRYNFWAGITGGFFLALSYFGTDQSQVGRYLGGKSLTESRLGLLFNGMLKIPMQFGILFAGIMVFVFYQFVAPPLFFNEPTLARVAQTAHAPQLAALDARYQAAFAEQRSAAEAYVASLERGAEDAAAKATLQAAARTTDGLRAEAKTLVKTALPEAETKDADYVFITFVLRYLPSGVVGLLIAVILCASMSSTASELSALGTTSMVDLYARVRRSPPDAAKDLRASKLFTALWGLVAVGFANFASMVDNLIQAVNIIGSIFYGTVLGLFMVAFFLKKVGATPVFVAALIAQTTVLGLYFGSELGFLWYNVIGCGLVMSLAWVFEQLRPSTPRATAAA